MDKPSNITFDQISKIFDTPSQIAINQLRDENEICNKIIKANDKSIAKLRVLLNREQDEAADLLDTMDINWRRVLIDGIKSNKQ
jgi:hypothetical protein